MAEPIIKIVWKVISVLKEQPPVGSPNNLFKIAENVGFYRQFGISLDYCHIPLALIPNIQFYQKMYSLFKRQLDVEIKELKPPYSIFIPKINNVATFNISSIRLFLPNILAVTVELSELPISLDGQSLIDLQYLHQIYPLNKIVQWIIGISETLDAKDYSDTQSFFARPAIRIDGISSSDLLTQHIEENLNEYVGILIRNPDYDQMKSSIATKIWEENRYLTDKTAKKKLMLNKQGFLYITATLTNAKEKSQPPDFARTFDLYEIALFFDTFIDQYISLKLQNETFIEAILYKIHPWVEAPEVVFRSFSYKNIWELLLRAFSLKTRVDYLTKKVDFEREREFNNEYNRALLKSPEAIKFFRDIGDTVKSSTIENGIKDITLLDLEQAELAYKQGAFKACVVMLGAVLEGLMLGTIQRNDVLNKLKNDPACPKKIKGLGLNNTNLSAKIANDLGFEDYKQIIHYLMPDIEKSKIEGVQLFRNAIHPWKAIQEPQIYKSFDQSRAMVHLASLEILAKKILSLKIV